MENSASPEPSNQIVNTAPEELKIEKIEFKLDVEKAYKFYLKQILEVDRDLVPLLDEYNFKNALPDWKFELFIAILVGDKSRKGLTALKGKNSKNGNGPDLLNHEVKSGLNGSSFEYQYHRNSWKEKLSEEVKVGHVFVSHWNNYQNIDVRKIEGSELASTFASWENIIKERYDNDFRERCRLNITYKTIVDKGKVLLKIRDSKLA